MYELVSFSAHTPLSSILGVDKTPSGVSDYGFALCAYFKHKLKTMGHLQLHYIPDDFATTEDTSFHDESSKAVTSYMYKV